MTTQVEDQTPRNQYTATGGQTVFPYTFQTIAEGDIAVSKNGVALTITVDYTVSGLGVVSGGDITLVSPAIGGETITITRDMEFNRETDYQDAGAFLANTVDQDFNRLWLAAQELRQTSGLSLSLADTDDFTNVNVPMIIPAKSVRAGKSLAFDINGNPTAIALLQAGTSDSTLISYTSLDGTTTSVSVGMNVTEILARNGDVTAIDSGTANNYVLTSILDLDPYGYYPGNRITFKPLYANTGASTVDLNGVSGLLGARDLTDSSGAALASGFLDPANGYYSFFYDGSKYVFTGCTKVITSLISDDTITLDKLAGGTANKFLGFDGSGDPAEIDSPKLSSLSQYIETSEQTITLDSIITIAHGLSSTPKKAEVVLRCKSTDSGWAVDDEISIGSNAGFFRNGSGGSNDIDAGVCLAVGAVNISICTGEDIRIMNAGSFNYSVLDPTKWRYIARAWA